MIEKKTNDDNNGCTDNYDGNFDDDDDKNDQKFTNFMDYYIVKQGPTNSGRGLPPAPFRPMAERIFFRGGLP